MKIKELLKKNFLDITDEEFKYIGNYFSKHPDKLKAKPKVELHKCIWCKNLSWYDCLGEHLWECQKNPCDDLATQSDRLLTNRMITHKRKCDLFIKDDELIPYRK